MNDMQVFKNPVSGDHLRTLEKDGEVWFVAADVCRALDIQNHKDAIKRLDDDERMGVDLTDPHGRVQTTNCVNEPGFYSLVMGSRKPEARAFKRWVTHEVLPAIRKTGRYSTEAARGEVTNVQAALILKDCNPAALPSVHKLLCDAGFDLPPLQLDPPKAGKRMTKERFAKWFRECYEQRGMTYQDVADALATNKVNVYRWGHGLSQPREPYMRTITDYFGPCPDE